jgi:hypothetical protein
MASITVDDLILAANTYVPHDSEDRSMVDLILSLAQAGQISIADANQRLCDIHQSICLNAIISSSGESSVNTGVFCKCVSGTVLTTPAAGGSNVIRHVEFERCVKARGRSCDDYAFSRTGKSVDCMPLDVAGIANECEQALAGNVVTCGD